MLSSDSPTRQWLCIWNFFAAWHSDYSDNKSGGESDYNGNGGNDSEYPSFDRYAGRRCDDTTPTVSLSDRWWSWPIRLLPTTKAQFRDKKVKDRPECHDSSFSSITTRRGTLLKVSALLRGPCSSSSGESTRSSTLWGRLERSLGWLIQQRPLQG